MFHAPGRRTTFTNKRASWLIGLLVCDVCDASMLRRPNTNHGYGQWRCPDYHVAISLRTTENMVRDMLLTVAAVYKPKLAPQPAPAPPPDAEERLAKLAERYVAGNLTDGEWEAAGAAVLPPSPPEPEPQIAPDVAQAGDEWPGWSLVQRHRFASKLLTQVRVKRTEKRGPAAISVDRLDPRWRI